MAIAATTVTVARGVPPAVPAELLNGSSRALGNSDAVQDIFSRARERVAAAGFAYAGAVTPREAWELMRAGAAVLIDVRTAEELKFVGQVPEAVHVPWATGLALQRNPRFVRELEGKVRREDTVLFLCRSGSRSAAAAQAASESRFRNAFNVLEGFEGELDASQQRSTQGGWRYQGLPWTQD